MSVEPLVECTYGWGRVLRLYPDYVDVNGTAFALTDLVQIHSVYHSIMGIASARLELHFKRQKVILRGISAIDAAHKMVEYLSNQLAGVDRACENETADRTSAASSVVSMKDQKSGFDLHKDRESHKFWQYDDTQITPLNETAYLPVVRPASYGSDPVDDDAPLKEFSQRITTPVGLSRWQRGREEQRERKLKRAQTERALREHGFDVEGLARRLREEPLHDIPVPIRLLPGEYAYYTSDATLCGEPLNTTKRYGYLARDHGTLILTSERMIYIGRRCQMVLGYGRLLHVSRLRGAIAFMAEHWSKREIFEVPRPLECTMYLERILQEFQMQQSAKLEVVMQQSAKMEAMRLQSAKIEAVRQQSAKMEAVRLRLGEMEDAMQQSAKVHALSEQSAKMEAMMQQSARLRALNRQSGKIEAIRFQGAHAQPVMQNEAALRFRQSGEGSASPEHDARALEEIDTLRFPPSSEDGADISDIVNAKYEATWNPAVNQNMRVRLDQ
jgi:hypothetical protein